MSNRHAADYSYKQPILSTIHAGSASRAIEVSANWSPRNIGIFVVFIQKIKLYYSIFFMDSMV